LFSYITGAFVMEEKPLWMRPQVSRPSGGEKMGRETPRQALLAAMRLLPDSQANRAPFWYVFHSRPEAGRFWNDMMVNILQET
jgi:hypothetical protein